jgi:hypothetical protein
MEAREGPVTVSGEVLGEVGFMALLNVAVIKDAGVTLTTKGKDAGARTEVIRTTGDLEIITLRMRFLCELQAVKCHLNELLSDRRGPDKGAERLGSDLFRYKNALAEMFAKEIFGLT